MRLALTSLVIVVVCLGMQCAYGQVFNAHVDVTTGPPDWVYTVFNDEPVGNSNFITTFSLAVNAPVTVTGTPSGWNFDTDGATFISWFNADANTSSPLDIAPGASLGGFRITSLSAASAENDYEVVAWNHILDQPGPANDGRILSPTTAPASVPEPGPSALVAGFMVSAWIAARRVRRPI